MEAQGFINSSTAEDWASNPIFDRFWHHYNASQSWCHKHWLVSKNIRPVFQASPPLLLPPPPPPPPRCGCRRLKKRRGGGGKKSKKQVITLECDTPPCNDDTNMELDGDNVGQQETEHIEIDAGFVEFLTNSIKHRLERDKDKNNLGTGQNSWFSTLDDYIPVDKIGINRRVVSLAESLLPPTEVQGEERKRDMQILYGVNAERIQALESLMQVQFDVDFDKLNPPLWPNMPLKF